ncbi:hypothetical protein P9B03_04020 [Metasolibacillus meyeri]|uniref:Uncharacterized protein n=1 Tax=Metasolibacillus meyeri TaxID=1071052 RepID=A0AAW9NSB6_9BACL|nr:hypothetical protein [Metasolibacillus meyeri]MEC1177641.1 hypothetical protein [Metasolibacillus meyeri]
MDNQELDEFIEKYEEEIIQASDLAGINAERLRESLKDLVRAFNVIFDNVVNFWNVLKEFAINYLDSVNSECNRKERRLLYRLNLARPKIKSQVVDRKPRHFIRKIIY